MTILSFLKGRLCPLFSSIAMSSLFSIVLALSAVLSIATPPITYDISSSLTCLSTIDSSSYSRTSTCKGHLCGYDIRPFNCPTCHFEKFDFDDQSTTSVLLQPENPIWATSVSLWGFAATNYVRLSRFVQSSDDWWRLIVSFSDPNKQMQLCIYGGYVPSSFVGCCFTTVGTNCSFTRAYERITVNVYSGFQCNLLGDRWQYDISSFELSSGALRYSTTSCTTNRGAQSFGTIYYSSFGTYTSKAEAYFSVSCSRPPPFPPGPTPIPDLDRYWSGDFQFLGSEQPCSLCHPQGIVTTSISHGIVQLYADLPTAKCHLPFLSMTFPVVNATTDYLYYFDSTAWKFTVSETSLVITPSFCPPMTFARVSPSPPPSHASEDRPVLKIVIISLSVTLACVIFGGLLWYYRYRTKRQAPSDAYVEFNQAKL